MKRTSLLVFRTTSRIWCLGIALALCWIAPATTTANAQENPIVIENLKIGTEAWRLDRPADDVGMQIKGFASLTSVNSGEEIDFHISVSPQQSFKIDVYRMGWYGGKGGRLMHSARQLNVLPQPAPILDSLTGMVTAPWSSSYTLPIPTSWTSGIYLAKLTNAAGYDNYIIFVVRDDNSSADFLYQHAETTSQAYNNFPADGVLGKSLYRYNSSGTNTINGDPNAVKVSFDRPYAGHGAGLFFEWESFLIQWLEKEGYNITYSTNTAQHNNGANLLNYTGFISGGHDEYWTKEIFDAVENARDAGVHLLFTGANVAYWQSRLESNDRVLVVYKRGSIDPEPNNALKTVRFRDVGRAEQTLVGIQFKGHNNSWTRNTSYVVENSDHWIYENTGFRNGSTVSKIVGYEIDNLDPEYPQPPANGTQVILSDSPFINDQNRTIYADSSIYQASSGAWVFATGTLSWSWALMHNSHLNSGIQQTTANILNRFLSDASEGQPVDEFIRGDVDCDEVISAIDSLYVSQYSAGERSDGAGCPLDNPTAQIYADAGDVDFNGVTDSIDGLIILQCVVGVSNPFCESGLETTSAYHASIETVSSTAQITTLKDKNTLSLQLHMDDATLGSNMQSTVGSGTFELRYNSGLSQLTGCKSYPTGACNEIEPGVVRITFIDPNGLTGTHSIATLTFDSGVIAFEDLQVLALVDSQFRTIPAKIISAPNESKSIYRLFIPFLSDQNISQPLE